MNDSLPWLILFLPLLSAVLITLFTQRNARVSAFFSVGAILISLLLSIGLSASISHGPPENISVNWLKVGRLSIDFGIHLDAMSLLMLLIVTGVGSAIHLYSVAYMKGDRATGRFFAGLSLFTFAMLGVVLSDNFMQMFIFWELVGACSYLLIGFWYERAAAADAAKKAFLTNRLGDFGFLTGIILFWSVTGANADAKQSAHVRHRGDRHGVAYLLRRGWKIRPISPARLAARRHGRPDAGQRLDPCRDHGGRRRLYAVPGVLYI